MATFKDNRVILWMQDDALTPDAEDIHAAYERISNEMSRFNFKANGRVEMVRGGMLREHMQGAKLVAGGGLNDPFSEYRLANGIHVVFSGEGCSEIFVPTVPAI